MTTYQRRSKSGKVSLVNRQKSTRQKVQEEMEREFLLGAGLAGVGTIIAAPLLIKDRVRAKELQGLLDSSTDRMQKTINNLRSPNKFVEGVRRHTGDGSDAIDITPFGYNCHQNRIALLINKLRG